MKLLRTPESIFENLKDFSFDPHYVDIEEGENKIRMHYLEEGLITIDQSGYYGRFSDPAFSCYSYFAYILRHHYPLTR